MSGRNKWPPASSRSGQQQDSNCPTTPELREGDIIFDGFLIRENGDGTHTLYRDGWQAEYRIGDYRCPCTTP